MGCGRALLCILLPPLAVLDRGCGTIVIVTLLTFAGWIPGVIAALLLNAMARENRI
ncbi:MAG: YqaE/Pmp3 family membrane protein [Chloroflexota bacterium]|nr:YqaE/Pmp3 family membrane protein [Chloroflexota bacterium]